jgi:protein-S-isoprenylcysteine O-methyltransferase Ste14
MERRLLISYAAAMLVLPGTVLVVVPAFAVWLAKGTSWAADPASAGDVALSAGIACAGLGVALAAWTNRLFLLVGRGTPAPWDPPRRFVVHGPYRHVRNPMMLAVFLMLAGEALVLRCPAVAAWLAIFIAVNTAYIPLSEEKGLERRFGDDYRDYRRAVPRWLPRLTPWSDSGPSRDGPLP